MEFGYNKSTKEKITYILRQIWRKKKAKNPVAEKNATRKIRKRTRPIIEPWTKKRKWWFFILGTIVIVLSGQLVSRGYMDIAEATALFAFGTVLDIIGLWLTEKRIRYFELDVKSDKLGTGDRNIEERLSEVEDFVRGLEENLSY